MHIYIYKKIYEFYFFNLLAICIYTKTIPRIFFQISISITFFTFPIIQYIEIFSSNIYIKIKENTMIYINELKYVELYQENSEKKRESKIENFKKNENIIFHNEIYFINYFKVILRGFYIKFIILLCFIIVFEICSEKTNFLIKRVEPICQLFNYQI